jgi:hypothetical protein
MAGMFSLVTSLLCQQPWLLTPCSLLNHSTTQLIPSSARRSMVLLHTTSGHLIPSVDGTRQKISNPIPISSSQMEFLTHGWPAVSPSLLMLTCQYSRSRVQHITSTLDFQLTLIRAQKLTTTDNWKPFSLRSGSDNTKEWKMVKSKLTFF